MALSEVTVSALKRPFLEHFGKELEKHSEVLHPTVALGPGESNCLPLLGSVGQ